MKAILTVLALACVQCGAPPAVLALGDSITEGNVCAPCVPWPKLAACELGTRFENGGVSGYVTGAVLSRWRARARDPRTLVMMAGINDALRGVPASTARRNLETIWTDALEHGASLVLMTVTPCHGFAGCDAKAEATRVELNAAVLAFHQAHPTTYLVDANALLRDPAKPLELAKAFDTGDGLHPNQAGEAVLASAVAESLRSSHWDPWAPLPSAFRRLVYPDGGR